MAKTVRDVTENIMLSQPRGLCALKISKTGQMTVEWSDMPIEVLVFAHKFLGLIIDKEITKNGIQMGEPTDC